MPFPLDISYVRETEGRLGQELPAAYVASMVTENGGDVHVAGDSWFLHPILDSSDKTRLKRTCNDIVHETKEAREWEGFPAAGVSIAHDGGGNHLILIPEPSYPGRLGEAVFRWDHETGEVDLVAPSFSALR
jgi:hypothetical protein